MTPADRPTGWVLLRPNGTLLVQQIYVTLAGADRARERWGAPGVNVSATVTPLWTRDAWARHVAALDSRVT